MEKLRVAFIFGGMSNEHEVSLMSVVSVLENLPDGKYDAFPIGITKDGRWLYYPGPYEAILSGEWEKSDECVPAVITPDRSIKGLLMTSSDGSFYTQQLDAIFPVLHGKYGEDGTVQGLFALSGIPFVGADMLSSAICMDKEVANRLMDHGGVPHIPWSLFRHGEESQFPLRAAEWEHSFGYPMFVKPANSGSSVGVSKADDRASLKEAIALAFLHDNKAIIEKAVAGKELECAVFGDDMPVASVVSEIFPINEFYDYDAKYNTPSVTVLPADIDAGLSDELREMAVRVYSLLGCGGMARVDFLYDDALKTLYVNELNTIPGFTSISMYPKMMEASGVAYSKLIENLIDLAIKRGKPSCKDL
ncbi:MAG: D-alanine--D-alanine ligase [Oscillospiraceae bacterium]|nr:D-alanine--D-alanine ligase [Oscillospiraceae bacterium]